MRTVCFTLGLIAIGLALRSTRLPIPRKLGAICLVLASGLFFALLCHSWWALIPGLALWLLAPAPDVLGRLRRLRLPLRNVLRTEHPGPTPTAFPHAERYLRHLSEAGYEFIEKSGWSWASQKHHHHFFWHAEARTVADLCLCEHEHIFFCYLSLTSHTPDGAQYRTTNYPFAFPLIPRPGQHWKRVACDRETLAQIEASHRRHLTRHRLTPQQLAFPDPETAALQFQTGLMRQIDYNLQQAIIAPVDAEHFRYTWRGLIYRWKSTLLDLLHLC